MVGSAGKFWLYSTLSGVVLGLILAAVVFAQLSGGGLGLDYWGASLVGFTFGYCAVLGGIATSLASVVPWLISRWLPTSSPLPAVAAALLLARLSSGSLATTVLVWLHGGMWSIEFVTIAVVGVVCGVVLDFALLIPSRARAVASG